MQKLFAPDRYRARDPHVICYRGKYYHCYTQESLDVHIACADRLEDLPKAQGVCVWQTEPGHPWSSNVWAPELHQIDGKWYIYMAADDGEMSHHRMYVLENGSDDPMKPYSLHGKITDETDQYAIDGTVMHYNGSMYLAWSGRQRDDIFIQNIYIAKMRDPYTLESPRVLISKPELEWEKRGGLGIKGRSYVNEGPFAFTAQGRQFLAYSAAGSWCEDYCIAMLELVGEDPLDPDAWKKWDQPVFSKNDLVKGAGHCSVICQEDKMYVFFHAWDAQEPEISWTRAGAWMGELKLSDGVFTVE